MMKTLRIAIALVVSSLTAVSAAETLVYFGTYTRGEDGSKGIYVSKLDLETGKLTEPELAAESKSPSFVAIHPNEKYLYAVSEISNLDGKKTGGVSAFKIDRKSGKLTLINTKPSGGTGPCHVSVDGTGKCVLVANYGGGSSACLAIGEDGSLEESSFIQHKGSSVNERRQSAPHAHSANPGPNNQFAFVADLGLDKVLIYKLDPAKAKISEHGAAKVAPGSGPRHFAFHPNGKWAYVINEMTLTTTAFTFDPEAGTLTEIQTLSTIPDADREQKGLSTAEIQVHPSGKFVYGSNRGHDTIAVYKVDPGSGKLTIVENEPIQGKTPRNFGIDPSGQFLLAAGQGSNTVAVFRINQDTGELDYTGNSIEVQIPVCVRFLPLK